MAFRCTSYWKMMASRLRGSKATYTTSTSPKMKAYAPAADFGHLHREQKPGTKLPFKGDFVPVYVALGMIALSLSLGLYTAKHQVLHSPGVRVRKKMRETMPEVEEPDKVVEEADKFVKKSFFRKVAHIQDSESGLQYSTPHPIRKDTFANQPHVETLKTIGIDPKQM